MKTIKKVKYKSGDLILRKNAGLILPVTTLRIDLSGGSRSPPFKGRGRGGVCIVIIHVCFRFIEKFAAKIVFFVETTKQMRNRLHY